MGTEMWWNVFCRFQ